MPIRMVPDSPEDQNNQNRRDNDRRDNNNPPPQPNPQPQPPRPGGGGNTPWGLIIGVLGFIFVKKPKWFIPIILIGAIWYFFLGGSAMFAVGEDNKIGFGTGCDMKEEIYDKAQVYASLAESSKNRLPTSVSLLKYAPNRSNQGRQGSCVGWASAFAARTILEAQSTGADPNSLRYSPSFLYNQIALRGCQGSYLNNAMETMLKVGSLPLPDFPYDERTCGNQPSRTQKESARPHRTKGYNRLSQGGSNYSIDMAGIKQNLAQGGPIVIGMMVGDSFTRGMRGRKVFQPSRSDYSGSGLGGHAMCVIGYDDNYSGGAFQLMNSWGREWGDDGIGWVRYSDFEFFVKEAYGLYPMGQTVEANAEKLAVSFGLLDNATQRNIPMKQLQDNLFRTKNPISKGDKFKVEVTNSVDCYTYVFGMETDGSSYVLFPYTEKHTAYCGITGTRVFPKDFSMMADDIGSTDIIAVVVSKTEIDYKTLNAMVNRTKTQPFDIRITEALNARLVDNVAFRAGTTVDLVTNTNGKKDAVVAYLAIDKK